MLSGYGAARVRDAAYLNWKYANHPNLDYRSIVATRAGAPAGFLVWRLPVSDSAERRAVIADFLVTRGDADTLRSLVSMAIVESARAGLETLSILSTQPWAIRMLRGHGFFPRGGTNTWAVGGWRDRIPQEWLSTHEPWHICLGDSDGDIWTGSQ
jgi:hypothetical protein